MLVITVTHMLASSLPQLQLPLPHTQYHGSNLPRRNPRMVSSLLPTNAHDSILMFHHLLSDGSLVPNHLTFPTLFRACPELSAAEQGMQLHAQAIKRGFHIDPFVQRSLIRMYSRFLACQDAYKVFVRCVERDVVCQNDLILGLARIGDLDVAREIFDGMAEKNVVSWSIMVDAYAKNGRVDIAQQLFDVMPERNEFSWNSLISGYLKCSCVEVARRFFDSLRLDCGVVTWTLMISGYVQNNMCKEALELFLDMRITGVVPNSVTIVSVLPAIAHLGALGLGHWIHTYVLKMGVEVDGILGSALLDMYAKCGRLEDSLAMFDKLKHKELSAWNSIILGLAAHGRGEDALHFFSRMREDLSVIPNDITFVALLSACSHTGLVDKGWLIFDLFTNYYNLTPNIRHYGCMVDLLGRSGLLIEALEFVERMPVEPNSIIWKTLLSACRIHKNIDMADRISREISHLGPQDSGYYTLMSNMFNEVGRREDACKLRREMNNLQVQKVAGCSWVEVDGVVHEFLMGRESFHAQGMEILSLLRAMEVLLKAEEYEAEIVQQE